MSASNYPPGVTGREPQITGEWPCVDCGAIMPEDAEGDTCPDGCDDGSDEAFDRMRDERAEGVDRLAE